MRLTVTSFKHHLCGRRIQIIGDKNIFGEFEAKVIKKNGKLSDISITISTEDTNYEEVLKIQRQKDQFKNSLQTEANVI